MSDQLPEELVLLAIADDETLISDPLPVPEKHTAPQRRGSQRRVRTGARPKVHALRELKRIVSDAKCGELLATKVDTRDRPRTRAECGNGPRPCPWAGCRHHLALSVNPRSGAVTLNFPDKEIWELEETCSLDVAERGGATLDVVGRLSNITRERARQIESKGLATLKAGGRVSVDDLHEDE